MTYISAPSVIWRATSLSGGKGVEPGDSFISFELTPNSTQPDSTGHIHQTEFKLTSGVGENERSLAQANELQDTKFEGLVVTITGSCQIYVPPGILGSGTQTSNVTTSKIWLIEDKVINNVLPQGRFGLRLNDFPFFNLTPSVNWGIILQDWTWTRISEQANRADFVATLRFSFAGGQIGTSPYNWT